MINRAFFCILALTGVAIAQSDPALAQGRGKQATAITITNGRASPLTEFEVGSTGANPVVVGKIGRPLAPGKSVRVAWKTGRGCLYDLRAIFADQTTSEAESFDICKDAKLRLTE